MRLTRYGRSCTVKRTFLQHNTFVQYHFKDEETPFCTVCVILRKG